MVLSLVQISVDIQSILKLQLEVTVLSRRKLSFQRYAHHVVKGIKQNLKNNIHRISKDIYIIFFCVFNLEYVLAKLPSNVEIAEL